MGFRNANRNFGLGSTKYQYFLGTGDVGTIPARKVLCVVAHRMGENTPAGEYKPEYWYKGKSRK